MNEEILKKVTDHYINSGDFNGLPNSFNIDEISELINEGYIEILWYEVSVNPYIKGLPLTIPIEKQIEALIKDPESIVLYPSKKHLSSLELYHEKPFTNMLLNGEAQLKILFFSIEVLEYYFQNPKYEVVFWDYCGDIRFKDDGSEDSETLYIRDFGIGYKLENPIIKTAAIFLRDLSHLPCKDQKRWELSLLEDQRSCKINKPFYDNLILGKWTDSITIYNAILAEISVINDMCSNIGILKLFRRSYPIDDYSKRPNDYHTILLPTKKNYYAFISTLEKMVTHNINIKTFLVDLFPVYSIPRKDSNGKDKNSITMLSEWINRNIRGTTFDPNEVIIQPLKKIQKLRQTPAHELYENEYDEKVWSDQNKILEELYYSLSVLRQMLGNHPKNKSYVLPDYLSNSTKIAMY